MEKLIIILHCKHLIMCNYSVKMFASIHKKEYACRHVLHGREAQMPRSFCCDAAGPLICCPLMHHSD